MKHQISEEAIEKIKEEMRENVGEYHRSPGVPGYVEDGDGEDDDEDNNVNESDNDSDDDGRGCPECNDDIDFTDIEDELPYECDNCPAFFAEISQRSYK